MSLNGKLAVVTGAGGVLCSEFARYLAKNDITVILLDINLQKRYNYIANGGIR